MIDLTGQEKEAPEKQKFAEVVSNLKEQLDAANHAREDAEQRAEEAEKMIHILEAEKESLERAVNHWIPFSGLSPAQVERLVLCVEESLEVGAATCKILRHGYESTNKGKLGETNREALEREAGDFEHTLHRLHNHGEINMQTVVERGVSTERTEYVNQYLHHQSKEEK